MSDIRDLMRHAVREVRPSPGALGRVYLRVDRRRRRRRVASAMVALIAFGIVTAILASAFLPLATGRSQTPRQPGAAAGSTVFPLTFPDGTRVELVMPSSQRLGSMGIQARITGYVENPQGGGTCCERTVEILGGSPSDLPLLSDKVVQVFPGADGSVELREGSPEGAELYLVYTFGPWTALVADTYDGMSEEERGGLGLWAHRPCGRRRVPRARGPAPPLPLRRRGSSALPRGSPRTGDRAPGGAGGTRELPRRGPAPRDVCPR